MTCLHPHKPLALAPVCELHAGGVTGEPLIRANGSRWQRCVCNGTWRQSADNRSVVCSECGEVMTMPEALAVSFANRFTSEWNSKAGCYVAREK